MIGEYAGGFKISYLIWIQTLPAMIVVGHQMFMPAWSLGLNLSLVFLISIINVEQSRASKTQPVINPNITGNPTATIKSNRLAFFHIIFLMDTFVKFIRTIIGIDDIDLNLILSKCRERKVPKGKFLLKKGQIATQYFFIVSGGIRFFYDTTEKENTTWVVFKNEFFTEISSLHPQKPSRFNIEAIEETELLVIDKSDMDFLYGHIPVWQEFGRKIWEAMTVRMIDQILNFQTLSAEERYMEFLNNPEFLQKVPVKDLAAVLGITPNALSRIRKNIR